MCAEDAPRAAADGLTLAGASGRWVLAIAVLGSGMAFLDGTVVNVALPSIGRDLHASTGALQWVLDGYLLTLAALILLGGSLGDRYGRRRTFRWGTALFTSASLLCALAPTAASLIAARLLQGVGAALLTPGSLAMIEASFSEQERSRAIGAWSGLTGVAVAAGPLLGGYLIAASSWRAVFLINLPIGALVLATAGRVPESRDPSARGRVDFVGAALAALCLGTVTYALIDGSHAGVTPVIALTAAAGVAAALAFLRWERRTQTPMLPLAIFSSSQFNAANLVTFVVYGALGGVFFMLIAFLQISLGYSPLEAGAASLPVTALMLALSERSGALAQRIGPRIPLAAGPLAIAAGMEMMAQIAPGDTYLASVLPAVVVFGLGLTLVVSPVTATALAALPAGRAGIASATNNAVARLAGLLAVAVLPPIAGLGGRRFFDPAAMTGGFHVAMLLCAAVAAAGGALAWLTIRADALGASVPADVQAPGELSCPIAGPPWRTAGASRRAEAR